MAKITASASGENRYFATPEKGKNRNKNDADTHGGDIPRQCMELLDLEKPAPDACAEPRLGQVAEQEFGLEDAAQVAFVVEKAVKHESRIAVGAFDWHAVEGSVIIREEGIEFESEVAEACAVGLL